MFIVVRRGAVESIARGGELAGAAAVRCLRRFADDERFAEDVAAWRPRPGKVTLRARGGQWDQLLRSEPHVARGEGVVARPRRGRWARGPLRGRLQAMTSALEPPPEAVEPDPARVTYLVNPRLDMTSGKTLAQIAHAAVMAADGGLDEWAAAGCPADVVSPPQALFDELCDSDGLAARVVDAGLTEVAPGTVTVLALAPGRFVPGPARESLRNT